MNKQTEIKEKTPLLCEDGVLNPSAVGWARRCLIEYDRERIPKKLRFRRKEWDFYQISNGEWMVQLNFANISVAAAASFGLVNLRSGESCSAEEIELFTQNRLLPTSVTAESPSHFEYRKNKTHLLFDVKENGRTLDFSGKTKNGKTVEAHFEASYPSDNESITITTPFDCDRRRFFLTTKFNCMPTDGYVKIGGETITFDRKNTYTVLDWGRGVWPHKNYWYWGNGTKEINGKLFGFEMTWGIGNTSAATETCVFYDGKANKIGAVDVETPPKINGYMKPWVFKSDDGKFDLKMTPYYDHESGALVLGLIGLKSHQVHGYFNGSVTLDDGTVLEVKDMYAFCEYVENLW
jgi:hypothetical protein